MIGLRRTKVTPPTLRAGGEAATAAETNEQRRRSDPGAEIGLEPHWQNADVRGALYAMQGWVCAYCQRKIDRRDHKYVDHFRPKKGGYWWLSYQFANYFLTCGLCNERKGERFPIDEGASRLTYETQERILVEERMLLDLVADPVDLCLYVDVDDQGGHYGEVVARLVPIEPALGRRAERTIDFFALNEDVDHLQERVRLLDKVTSLHREGKHDKLRRRASRYRHHAATVRSFLGVYAPELLPDGGSELTWFLTDLCERLKADLDERGRWRARPGSNRSRAIEIVWALAYLWMDPPAGTAEDVARLLERMECKRLVERYYKRLAVPEPGEPPEEAVDEPP